MEEETVMTMQLPDERETAERAYALWEARGNPIGSPARDWFEAERQLKAELDDVSQPKATLDALQQATADELLDVPDRARTPDESNDRRSDGGSTYVVPEATSGSRRSRRRVESSRNVP
jgi:hypothetical protein